MPRKLKKDQRPICNRIRVLRTETDLSRAALAERVGVNPQTIGAIERGDHFPSLDLAMSICEVFSLPVESVFSRTPFIYTPSTYGHSDPSPSSPEWTQPLPLDQQAAMATADQNRTSQS